MRALFILLALIWPATTLAEGLLATRTLRPGTVIEAQDIAFGNQPAAPGIATLPEEVIGMEPRVTLYAGRAIPLSALTPPAMIERNQLVTLRFARHGLEIQAEGRALARGAEGEVVRVMNLTSRNIVMGQVIAPGLVVVQN
jgi:flagellar basal body P-ring formation protein FlgA